MAGKWKLLVSHEDVDAARLGIFSLVRSDIMYKRRLREVEFASYSLLFLSGETEALAGMWEADDGGQFSARNGVRWGLGFGTTCSSMSFLIVLPLSHKSTAHSKSLISRPIHSSHWLACLPLADLASADA